MNTNPFVLPGFGQTGAVGQNPILASMEMMRQAWEGLASSGSMDPAAMGRIMSVEEMDKRIADLRAVENWLRMNLSMLTSTIQGLEVQRATVATLKSFVDTGLASVMQPSAPEAGANEAPARSRPAQSLDEVLGLKPSAAPEAQNPAAPQAPAAASDESAATPEASTEQADVLAAAASATQGWWNLLQQQFQNLASATAASAEGALADFAEAGKAVADSQAAAMSAAPAGKPAAKSAARKAPSKKTAAKKTAAKKSAARTAAKTGTKTAAKAAPRAAKKAS